jgi:hypothetical protein
VHPLDQAEVIQDLYGLDLADGWRGRLEEHMFEDTDSEMLYQDAMDGFDCDVELNTPLGPRPDGTQGLVQALQRLLRSGLRALITKPHSPLGSIFSAMRCTKEEQHHGAR